ncbi:hypothetical protein Tco_0581099 [Tanacetum coccineum]
MSESYVHFVHPLEDAKQYSNPIVSLTLSAASSKTTSLSASTFSCLNASLWAASIIPLTRLDFTLSFLLNASPTTFAVSEYHTDHSSKSVNPLLVLCSTHTSDSSQIGKFAPQLHESAGGLPKTKLVSHSCSLAGSTSAMEVSIPIAFVLPGREHECNESLLLSLKGLMA